MLSDNNAIATIAVTNLEKSKEFYERTLGLSKVMENDEVLTFDTVRMTRALDDLRSRETLANRSGPCPGFA